MPIPQRSPTMNIVTLPDAAAVAQETTARLLRVVAEKADASLILPAGATPIPTYQQLIARSLVDELDLSRAHVFQLDELVGVGAADRRSFHAFLKDTLLDHLPRKPETAHLLDGTADDPVAEILAHAGHLRERGGADLALLGLGVNGHVGYNEPGTRRTDGARHVDLDETTRGGLRAVFSEDETPHHGITLGITDLLNAKQICIQVTGSGKAEVLQRVLQGPITDDLPATHLREHADLTWLIDEAAAARL